MLILSIESSAKPASVAVSKDGELFGQYFQNSGLTHSRTLMAMAESLLRGLEIQPRDVGLVAVSRGPGSFTGVRIGVSAAKGLAWGLGIPVCGVSTLEAMAYQASEPNIILCPVMDARRNQVYNALFIWREGALSRLCDDRAISLGDLTAQLGSEDLQAPCLLLGDGAAMTYDYLKSSGIDCRIAPDLLRWQTAYGVALAASTAEHIPAIELEPSYLRPPQAERERKKAE